METISAGNEPITDISHIFAFYLYILNIDDDREYDLVISKFYGILYA